MTESDVLGPIDYVVVEFPTTHLDPRVAAATVDLVAGGLVRVIDAALVVKEADGSVEVLELDEIPAADSGKLAGLDGFITDLISEDDLLGFAEVLDAGTSALVVIWENSWAARFVSEVFDTGGRVFSSGRLAGVDVLGALES